MRPGTLVTNIGHFKEIRIQPSFCNRFAEKRLVGSRCTGSYNNPIQTMLFDALLNRIHTILRAGIHQIFGVFNIGKRSRIFGNVFYIYNTGNIDSARADKSSYSGTITDHIFFYFFIFADLLSVQSKIFYGFCYSTRSSCYRFWNITGTIHRSANINPFTTGFERSKIIRSAETKFIELYIKLIS